MFNHCTVEVLLMRWLKRKMWKAGIAITGMLLLLVLMISVPVSTVEADEGTSGLVTPGTVTVQATPTEDATVTTLNKEKLAQEVQQLKSQNEPDPFGWLRTNASIFLSTLVVVIGALFGLWQWSVGRRDAQNKELDDRKAERERRDEEQQRWLEDREAEREKRVEERFQSAVTALGDEKEGTRIGAAILLRTFLHPDYKQFHAQIFDLVVANLRLPRTTHQSEDPTLPQLVTPFSQALVTLFKESFPLVREKLQREHPQFNPESLDASHIQLDHAYLSRADLKQAWLPGASLRGANLYMTDLRGADLNEADLSKAYLSKVYLGEAGLRAADLREAELQNAHLGEAYFRRANFRRADLSGADLSRANLKEADLSETLLSGANLSQANLSGADLSGATLNATRNFMTALMAEMDLEAADLSGADLKGANLSETDLEAALSLKDTDLRGVKGLTKEQLEACQAKGAIIDEDFTTSSSQSTISPPSPEPRNEVQAPSTASVQEPLDPEAIVGGDHLMHHAL